VFEISAEELQVSLVNHTSTFTSPPVVQTVRALLDGLKKSSTRTLLIDHVANKIKRTPKFVAYVLDLLENTGCLYRDSESSSDQLHEGQLRDFFACIGSDPGINIELLSEATPVVVLPESEISNVSVVLENAGINGRLVGISAGTSCKEGLRSVRKTLDDGTTMLVSWNFAYRMPFSRLLNDLAIERDVPILFGVCEGVVGHLGPYVIPQNTACLECVVKRMIANAGGHENRVLATFRTRYQNTVPSSGPTHPLFREAIFRLLVIELSRILLQYPPITIGGVIEHTFGTESAHRHVVLKVPFCESCHPARPQRIPWDAHFSAPIVKSGGV